MKNQNVFVAHRLQHFLAAIVFVLSSLHVAQASVPADASVELNFSDGPGAGDGITTTNLGTLAGSATFKDPALTNAVPSFSTNVPAGLYAPAGNAYSVDLGTFVPGAEGHAVDLVTTATPPGDGKLGALPKVTICGWVNARTFSNRGQIAYALESAGGLGISLAHNSVGSVQLGINQNSQLAPISVLKLTTDSAAGSNNWIFIAVTYDPALPLEQLKYYFGRGDKFAYLDSAHTYLGGDIVTSNGFHRHAHCGKCQ